MANILIVSGSYYPYATANAVCMREFEKAMTDQGHTVTYVIKRHDIDIEEKTIENGIEIYHIPRSVDEFYTTCEKLKKVCRPQPLETLFRSGLFFIKVILTLYAKVFYGSVRAYSEDNYIKQYAKKIKKIVEEKNINTIISVSMPFLSHKAVLKYEEQYGLDEIKWISVMFDPYIQVTNECEIKGSIKENIKDELRVFENSSKIIMLNVLKESYNKALFKKFQSKIEYIELPLLNFENVESEKVGIRKVDSKIDIVFAGTLYDSGRSLEFFSEFLQFIDSEKFRFHFMGKIYPENRKKLEMLNEIMKSEIIIYGMMPYSFAEASIEAADIVINIGNVNTNQIPSKIFQYISKGKMILSFYKVDNDPSLPILERYPLAYNVYENDMLDEARVQAFLDFYEKNKNTVLDIKQLEDIYRGMTSKDVCQKFVDYLEIT